MEKKKKNIYKRAQDCVVLKWIKANPWQQHLKKYFILAVSCISLDICPHTLVANEEVSYDQEVKH